MKNNKKILYICFIIYNIALIIFIFGGCNSPFDDLDNLNTSVNIGRINNVILYKDLMKSNYPETCITGEFNDWRSVSKYRSKAGYHLGYDFAAPEGTKVPAGWEGTVTDIIYWGYREFAVEVTGTTETGAKQITQYGHLKPVKIYIGDKVKVGQTIGKIAVDHVDIKMKINGEYYDWGQ
ncbi:MAG: Peptidase family M23 [bacterium ADurb.Bin363]|nr:MAG: Peptidase family M23 [bacterium ADurb.Bin363]